MNGTVSTTASVYQKSASWIPPPELFASGFVNGPIDLNGSAGPPSGGEQHARAEPRNFGLHAVPRWRISLTVPSAKSLNSPAAL
jgi:hypothetical protein